MNHSVRVGDLAVLILFGVLASSVSLWWLFGLLAWVIWCSL